MAKLVQHPTHSHEQEKNEYINYLAELAPARLSGKAMLFFSGVMVAPFMLGTMLGLALMAITLYKYAHENRTFKREELAPTADNNSTAPPATQGMSTGGELLPERPTRRTKR